MVSLRPKLGFAAKTGAHDPASFKENDAKFTSVLQFMENHLGKFSKKKIEKYHHLVNILKTKCIQIESDVSHWE